MARLECILELYGTKLIDDQFICLYKYYGTHRCALWEMYIVNMNYY